jgi:hypothetical protein
VIEAKRSAKLSACGTYRYALARTWNPVLGAVLFILLNPSDADAIDDDATVRKCIGFTHRWGHGAVWIANMFAYRTPKPAALRRAQRSGVDIVGPLNREAILANAADASRIVVGWGANAVSWAPYAAQVVGAVRARVAHPVECLGLTNDGMPRHPLRLAYSTPLELLRDHA